MDKNIVLIGMPGCGKTTISQIISPILSMNCLDIDLYIQAKHHTTIPEIFKEGEDHFRDIESKAVEDICMIANNIIATGGGVIKREININNLKKNGIIVFIDRPLERILGDLDSDSRPLLKNNRDNIVNLYNQRIDLYRKYADHIVTNDSTLDDIAQSIVDIYKSLS